MGIVEENTSATSKIYNVLGILLIFSLPLKALPNILVGLLLAIAIFFNFSNGYHRFSVRDVFSNRPIIVLSALIAYIVIKSLFYQSLTADFERFSRFILIIVVVCALYPLEYRKLVIAVTAAATLALIAASISLSIFYFTNGTLPLGNGQDVNEVLLIERPYLGFVCVIGSILALYLSNVYKAYRYFLIPLVIIFAAFIFLIVARLSLLTIILLLGSYFFYKVPISSKRKFVILFLFAGLTIIGLFSYKNISKRFLTNTSPERIQHFDPRVVIWSCASEVTKSDEYNVIFGSNSYVWINEKMEECYGMKNNDDPERKVFFIERGFNSHNQFFDFFLIGGLTALTLFIWFIVEVMRSSRRNFHTFALVVALTLFLIFENVFHRQFGCYLIGLILTLVIGRHKLQVNRQL